MDGVLTAHGIITNHTRSPAQTETESEPQPTENQPFSPKSFAVLPPCRGRWVAVGWLAVGVGLGGGGEGSLQVQRCWGVFVAGASIPRPAPVLLPS